MAGPAQVQGADPLVHHPLQPGVTYQRKGDNQWVPDARESNLKEGFFAHPRFAREGDPKILGLMISYLDPNKKEDRGILGVSKNLRNAVVHGERLAKYKEANAALPPRPAPAAGVALPPDPRLAKEKFEKPIALERLKKMKPNYDAMIAHRNSLKRIEKALNAINIALKIANVTTICFSLIAGAYAVTLAFPMISAVLLIGGVLFTTVSAIVGLGVDVLFFVISPSEAIEAISAILSLISPICKKGFYEIPKAILVDIVGSNFLYTTAIISGIALASCLFVKFTATLIHNKLTQKKLFAENEIIRLTAVNDDIAAGRI